MIKRENYSLLIKGGRLIDPAAKIDAPMDVLLRDGQVAEIAPPGKTRPIVAGLNRPPRMIPSTSAVTATTRTACTTELQLPTSSRTMSTTRILL